MAKPRGVGKRADLKGKVATVAMTRNGLTIEIQSIPAPDAGLVAAALLTAFRDLQKAGYTELIAELGSVGAGQNIDVPDEVDGDTAKQMGFTVRR